jgi:hypothetical protein
MNMDTAGESARSALMCEDSTLYSRGVIDAFLKCAAPKQIVNMDESGVTAEPFNGKKQKMASAVNCQSEPRFQDLRNVIHIFIVAMLSLGLNFLPPLFLTVCDVTSKDAELRQAQDKFHTFRTPRGYMTTSAMAF